jgi:glycine/D-amino acid oxidase-like deaminating enzyme
VDTKSGYPFWVLANGLLPSYPRIDRDQRCEVAIIGGGITAALIADELSRHHHDVVVVEKRDIGWGSTAASTALLQYEIDVHMTDLAKRYDEPRAALAYRSCVDSIEALSELARDLGDVGFQRTDSIYLASSPRDVSRLHAEQALRARYELPSRFLDEDQLAKRYGIAAPGALHTRVAAVIDPYRFTCRLFARAHRRGVRIYDRSQVDDVSCTSRSVTLQIGEATVRADHLIIAAGYESQQWLSNRVARNRSSYAVISDPVDPAALSQIQRAVFWETARPYHYLRTTTDHRLIVGGEDDRVDRPARRSRSVDRNARLLQRYAEGLFPTLAIVPAFAWAGTFAETRDGLPYFGAHDELGKRVLFAMAYGGNGIAYSSLGAGLLRAIIERREHPLRELYSFDR